MQVITDNKVWRAVVCCLLVVLGVMVWEAWGLISDIQALAGIHVSENPGASSIEEKRQQIDELVEKHLSRFLLVMLVLLIAVLAVMCFRSIREGTGFRPGNHEKTGEVDALDMLDELDETEALLEPFSDDEMEDDVFGDELLAEHPERGAEPVTLEDSYNKMMEGLQKINEMEKKHTIDLAEANKKLEKEVVERERAEKEIRRLSRKLISGIEEAQKKLAQDLHDEFGQTLAAFHMGLENLSTSLPDDLEDQKKTIRELVDLIEQLGDKIRSISSDLRPDLLDDLGLIPTLEWYIREFREQRPSFSIDFQAVGFKKRFSSEKELVLYRIFQESLNNIVKHAGASHAEVILTYNYPKVILMIKDDGIGFNPSERSSGIGLIGMRERAVSAGGTIEIHSEKGKGAAIRVEIPLS